LNSSLRPEVSKTKRLSHCIALPVTCDPQRESRVQINFFIYSTGILNCEMQYKYRLSYLLCKRRSFRIKTFIQKILLFEKFSCWSQWPRGLRRRSATAGLLRFWGLNPTGGMDVCCKCCVLSCRGLCDRLITRIEKSYRLWRVVVCGLETS
jgi:hypothetical protein